MLQVQSNPKQEGYHNCGVWTGLAAEVFATYAEGRFMVTTTCSGDEEVVCEGSNPTFLMCSDSWCKEEDVMLARVYSHAAAVGFWRTQYPGTCPEVDELWCQAIAKLSKTMPGTPSPGEAVWYVGGCCLNTGIRASPSWYVFTDHD